MRLIDLFERIYVLNLPERTDRLRRVSCQLDAAGMPMSSPKMRRFSAIKPEEREPFAKLGSKGCFLSVLEILDECETDGVGHVLIFQDDAEFTPRFAASEPGIAADLGARSWYVAQLGHYPLERPGRRAEPLPPPPAEGALVVPHTGDLIGAHAFAVHGSHRREFIDFLHRLLSRPCGHPDGGPMPIDGALNTFSRVSGVTRLIAVPSVVGQAQSRSDVTPQPLDRSPLLRPLASLARRFGLGGRGLRTH